MFPLHFPYRASPCAIRFQLSSTNLSLGGKRSGKPSETWKTFGSICLARHRRRILRQSKLQTTNSEQNSLIAPKLVMKFLADCVNPTFHYSANKSLTFDCPEPHVSSLQHAILFHANYWDYKSTLIADTRGSLTSTELQDIISLNTEKSMKI